MLTLEEAINLWEVATINKVNEYNAIQAAQRQNR
jgi:hypothetical protein